MMDHTRDAALRRSQVYRFLADAFLYPGENWLDDWPLLAGILSDLAGPSGSKFEVGGLEFEVGSWKFEVGSSKSEVGNSELGVGSWDLPALQAEHRRVFGLTGSLCYETECGLPHEFRQSQEMADIAGFYRAFGFDTGGEVRERPDHIAAELEFMHVLAIKEAWAAESGVSERVEVCADAGRKFIQDHLGRWVGLLAQALEASAGGGPYVALGRLAASFVRADAERLGARVEARPLAELRPTPAGPELSCEACPIAE